LGLSAIFAATRWIISIAKAVGTKKNMTRLLTMLPVNGAPGYSVILRKSRNRSSPISIFWKPCASVAAGMSASSNASSRTRFISILWFAGIKRLIKSRIYYCNRYSEWNLLASDFIAIPKNLLFCGSSAILALS